MKHLSHLVNLTELGSLYAAFERYWSGFAKREIGSFDRWIQLFHLATSLRACKYLPFFYMVLMQEGKKKDMSNILVAVKTEVGNVSNFIFFYIML